MKTREAIHWALYIILVITILSYAVAPKAWMIVLAIGIVLYVRRALNTKTEGD